MKFTTKAFQVFEAKKKKKFRWPPLMPEGGSADTGKRRRTRVLMVFCYSGGRTSTVIGFKKGGAPFLPPKGSSHLREELTLSVRSFQLPDKAHGGEGPPRLPSVAEEEKLRRIRRPLCWKVCRPLTST